MKPIFMSIVSKIEEDSYIAGAIANLLYRR